MGMMKTVTTFVSNQFDENFPPSKLDEFVSWCMNKLHEIPEEYRDVAEINIESHSDYDDCSYCQVSINYDRPMTPKEIYTYTIESYGRIQSEIAWANNRLKMAQDELEDLNKVQD